MRYHNITKDDMNNGDGLRVVLWVSGCEHHCEGCHNPVTWNVNDGKEFGEEDLQEIFRELDKSYVSGITFSGGDPLHPNNKAKVLQICEQVKYRYPNKTIWIYTGYELREILNDLTVRAILHIIDVLVDGRYRRDLRSVNYPWAGSTNQRVIDIKRTLKEGEVILHESN